MSDRDNLISYLATLFGIVFLALAAAAVCLFAKVDTEVNLARILGGLSFISAAITGLIGVIGTFRGRNAPVGNTQADANLATALDKLAPTTTGTGPAVPLEEAAPTKPLSE